MNKIIIIPPDSITNNISRSYFISKYLAANNIVYLLRWDDPQDLMFRNINRNKLSTLKCFINSLFSLTKIDKTEIRNLHYLYTSRMLFMVIYKFIGMENALKLSRFYNSLMLRRISKKIRPDVIFYADGFDGQPILLGDWTNISDIQDDFDSNNFRNNKYQYNYGKKNFEKCQINWVVSKKAANNLKNFYNANFSYLPNGVEIEEMLLVDNKELSNLKNNFKNKFIVSYIGGDAWVDYTFSKVLFEEALKLDSNIHFVVVGNLNFTSTENVSFIGAVPKNTATLYYHLSDIGLMLKASEGSNFLKNSIPLKIIQYSVLNKIFISPFISWLHEEQFNNIKILDNYTPQLLLQEIIKIKKLKKDLHINEPKWSNYDWETIVKKIEVTINSVQK